MIKLKSNHNTNIAGYKRTNNKISGEYKMPLSSVEILIEILKKHGIKKLVLSSGTRNIPFVCAVETDPDFECYSIIDERNAAFFALGIYQQLKEPVAIACTSGTAVSNYLTGITEAFYSHAQIIAITFDRSPYTLDQLETQKINQPVIFQSVCKKSVALPIIKDAEDSWYCMRLCNEALIAMRQHDGGPVHINIPLKGETSNLYRKDRLEAEKQNRVGMIDYLTWNSNGPYAKYASKLLSHQRILLVVGQSLPSEDFNSRVARFSSKYNIPILADNLSNLHCDNIIFAEPVIKALNSKTIDAFLPDIVISMGNNFQERIKDLLKAHEGEFEHWSISPAGIVQDVFRSETALFECSPEYFLEYFTDYVELNSPRTSEYLHAWQTIESKLSLPEMPFTNFQAIAEFSQVIPKKSTLHLSILNATRLMQFFKLDPTIQVFSNVNTFGIDGCLPTFIGQAVSTEHPAFLVIGDLSFFYGMNALGIKQRTNNIRILLINNGGAAEFHISPASNAISTIDLHIGAAHTRTAKGWAESLGYVYMSAHDENEFRHNLVSFAAEEHDSPVLFEVFTDMKKDGENCLAVYRHLEYCLNSTRKECE